MVVSTEDLSASVWRWSREDGSWRADKVITIPAEPADPDTLPPALKPFGAVPPLVTDIDLSVDDQFLYVSCWGTGELKQYDVSDPAHPREVGSVRLGGITGRVAHPAAPGEPLAGGPQMVEVSRDGKRIYLTNSLYGAWDDQFYPDGVGSWLAKIDTDPAAGGGLSLDEKFFPRGDGVPGPAGCTRSGWAAATRPRIPTATGLKPKSGQQSLTAWTGRRAGRCTWTATPRC